MPVIPMGTDRPDLFALACLVFLVLLLEFTAVVHYIAIDWVLMHPGW